MEWNNGGRCLQNFQHHLQGSYLSDWTQVVEAANDAAPAESPVHDMDFFTDAVTLWLISSMKQIGWSKPITFEHSASQRQ
jgi:hypothetical protein